MLKYILIPVLIFKTSRPHFNPPFPENAYVSIPMSNEVFARKEEQNEIGQLEHNKPRRLHQLYVSNL